MNEKEILIFIAIYIVIFPIVRALVGILLDDKLKDSDIK